MATTNGGPNPEAALAPAIQVQSQYIKDLSFENPNAPESTNIEGPHPRINVEFNVAAKPRGEGDIEVELKIEARASREDKILFNVDLVYGGIFRIRNVPPEIMQPVVLIECPRILFPFARQVLSDVTQNGGFPPLLLDPVDFTRLYHERFGSSAGPAQAQA